MDSESNSQKLASLDKTSDKQLKQGDKKKYTVKKRPPPKAPQRPNDIYISDHSNFKVSYFF